MTDQSYTKMILPCIICLKEASSTLISEDFTDKKKCPPKIFNVYCRIFNVDQKKFQEHLGEENLSLCAECLTSVNDLAKVFVQLQQIETLIQNNIQEIKIKILLSSENAKSKQKNILNGTGFLKYKYFRNRAIKDLNPTVNIHPLRSKSIANSISTKKAVETPDGKIWLVETKNNFSEIEGDHFEEDDFEGEHFGDHYFEDDEHLIGPHPQHLEDENTEIKIENEEINLDLTNNIAGGSQCSMQGEPDTIKDTVDVGNTTTSQSKRTDKTQNKTPEEGLFFRGVPYTLKPKSNSSKFSFLCGECFKELKGKPNLRQHIKIVHLGGKSGVTPDGKVLTKKGTVRKVFHQSHRSTNLGAGKWSYKKFEYFKDEGGNCQCVLCGTSYSSTVFIQQHISKVHVVPLRVEYLKKFTKKGTLRKQCKTNKLMDGIDDDNVEHYENLLVDHDSDAENIGTKMEIENESQILKDDASSSSKFLSLGESDFLLAKDIIGTTRKRRSERADKRQKRKQEGQLFFRGIPYSLKPKPNSSEYIFQCDECFKECHRKANLRQHITIVHLGGRSGVTLDGKALTKKGTVRKVFHQSHRAIHLGGEKWSFKKFQYLKDITGKCQCVLCGTSYGSTVCIQKHISKVHVVPVRLEYLKKFTKKGTLKKQCQTNKLTDGIDDDQFEHDENQLVDQDVDENLGTEGEIEEVSRIVKDDTASSSKCLSLGESDFLLTKDIIGTTRKRRSERADKGEKRKQEGQLFFRGISYSLKPKPNSSEFIFQCDECFREWHREGNLRQHITMVHLGGRSGVSVDGKALTKKGTVRKVFHQSHRAIHLGGEKWSFKKFQYLKDVTGKWQCVLCGTSYGSIGSVQQHINFVHVTSLRTEHLKRFTKKGTPRKEIRSVKLEDGKMLWKNIEYRIEDDAQDKKRKLYYCGACQVVTKTGSAICKHINRKHVNPNSKICQICGKKFDSQESFEEHKVSHKDEKSATCEECGQTFKYKSALYHHKRRVHLGERPYQCEFCGKTFFTRKDCRVHSATHNKDKLQKPQEKIDKNKDKTSHTNNDGETLGEKVGS